MPLAKNQIIPLSITALSSDGSGVGRWDGMPVFVPFTAVGDEVDARIVKVCRKKASEVHPIVWIVSALFILDFICMAILQ